ncbi:MAG: peptide chain release factor N(5)-glutamine methyltransferase [Bacteroidota bacterium]|jgi:release factor glutamine methyltransferase
MNWLQIANEWQRSLALLYPEQEIKSLFFIMLKSRFRMDKAFYLSHQQELLSEQQLQDSSAILSALLTGKPIQYILGETEFYGLNFRVNTSVLIPRPETEELVKWILDELKDRNFDHPFILDIGTGSGCIPIALKSELPHASVFGLDISNEALATARNNALLNGLDVEFVEQDILEADHSFTDGSFDIIVSNPPYITIAEKTQMHQNVLDFEPHTALFVPDQDPLIFYDRIADFALKHLRKDGFLFFEINEHLGVETCHLLQVKGFQSIELKKDLFGRDRMIKANL